MKAGEGRGRGARAGGRVGKGGGEVAIRERTMKIKLKNEKK